MRTSTKRGLLGALGVPWQPQPRSTSIEKALKANISGYAFVAALLSLFPILTSAPHAQAALTVTPGITGGAGHSLALKEDGTLWSWGQNLNGELGIGSTVTSAATKIGTGYAAIGATLNTSAAIKTDGSLWAWGYNAYGTVGDGTTTTRLSPVQIGTGFSKIDGGGSHFIALKPDGSLWAWGTNNVGQAGDGTTTQYNSPIYIGSGFSAISAGLAHSLALKTDGSLWAWGQNNYGQLGDGTTTNRLVPTQIGTGFTAISAGMEHSIALKSDGTIWTWGDNTRGQLGDGTTVRQLTPKQVASNYKSIAAGGRYSEGIKTDNTLWIWGQWVWQYPGSTSPQQIGANFYYVTSSGYGTSFGVKLDGTTWAWGDNFYGELGDGSASYRQTPVQLNFALFTPDITAPTTPISITATASGATSVNLTWTAATDTVGVTAYKVYRDGVLVTTLGNVTSHSDTGLTAGTAYSYTVSACDAAGNCSAQSTSASATTTPATATLSGITVSCPTTITSGQTGTCTANASYSSGPNKAVTPIWSTVLGAAATIDATGTITASTVTVDTAVVINASYVEGGVTKTASATVTITAAAAPVPAPGATACTGTAKNTAAISIDGGIFKQVGESL
ncbi:MAG: hypothetical protein HY850_00005, partial [Betaproteobacteria bacterium]|nr:hypothetical protein [Betaproteobacteria bacterium]